MRILPVTRDEFGDWLAMRRSLYTGLDEEFHTREMETIFASCDMSCFIGHSEVGDGVIGMLELSLRNIVDGCVGSPVGYIEGLYIKPRFRGRGFGRAFVAFAESWSLSHGCAELATDAELDNEQAQAFFGRIGFNETWRVVEFKKSLR